MVRPVLVTDLRHFEGIELDPGAPAPALRLATHLRRIVRAATVFAGRGIQPTALPVAGARAGSRAQGACAWSARTFPPGSCGSARLATKPV